METNYKGIDYGYPICPKCGLENKHAREDGYVEGPREYHADCWESMSETEQSIARERTKS